MFSLHVPHFESQLTKASPTFNLEGDLCLKSFLIGDALGFNTTQSTPSTLVGGCVHFFIGISFATFFVGASVDFAVVILLDP
jgi:hypothetical protein